MVEQDGDPNSDVVLFFADPDWEAGGQTFGQALRDEEGKLVHVVMAYAAITNSTGVYYQLDRTSYNELCQLSLDCERRTSTQIEKDNKISEHESREESDEDEEDNEEESDIEERVTILNRRERRCRGNRLAVVLGDYL